ncbi:hypothetical protein [Croceimicrobium hydrocarbonivorans]|uniref:Uncharacterized protein n=1 Tax=Croceimicrobium hydrocarbonivorans TaxID=2761580 RepID=A0A7H0VAR3_9FLAO|nr:hypothetical protein [Croceimicrobium hydrocarbonivorans]QNR22811.1 hypothetical protein H4K34_10505 [Croceimicrobium hydrocarbonivorans]
MSLYQTLISLSRILQLDFLQSFGIYSIVYFILRLFWKDARLKVFDAYAVKAFVYLGLTWFLLWLIGDFVYYFQVLDEAGQEEFRSELVGKYFFLFWLQALLWLLITQAFRWKRLSRYLLIRILAGLSFVFSIERLVIIITSLHRDYLASSWKLFGEPFSFEVILGSDSIILSQIFRLCLYIACTFLIIGIEKAISKWKPNPANG